MTGLPSPRQLSAIGIQLSAYTSLFRRLPIFLNRAVKTFLLAYCLSRAPHAWTFLHALFDGLLGRSSLSGLFGLSGLVGHLKVFLLFFFSLFLCPLSSRRLLLALRYSLPLSFILLSLSSVFAAEVSVQWNPNTEPNVAGYKIYYGTATRNYPSRVDVGNQTLYTLPNLQEGKVYYISATAYDISGRESDYSNELVHTVPLPSSSCTYSISSPTKRFDALGGPGTITVATQPDCTWEVAGNVSWITGSFGKGYQGNATANFSVQPNPESSTRVGTLSLAGQTLSVTQAGLSAYTVAVSSGPDGSITPAGPVTIPQGGGQSFTITPSAGCHIVEVTIDGNSQGPVSSYTFSNVLTNHSIAATFGADIPSQYTLSVSAAGTGKGAILQSPEGNIHNAGAVVTLTAKPDEQSVFGGWSGACNGMAAACTLTLSANTGVLASFFAARMQNHAAFLDIDGDGLVDTLWYDPQQGDVVAWFMNGAVVRDPQLIRTVNDPHWKMAGLGNIGPQGDYHIFWQNETTGQVYAWYMHRHMFLRDQHIRTVSDTNWKIVGIGDFDGDGSADILWQHQTTGDVYVWYMNGLEFRRDQPIRTVSDLNWKIAGVGDFNKDGQPDILWQHRETGDLYVWFMNGTNFVSDQFVKNVNDLNWKVVGVGDSIGNGTANILWQHQGTEAVYLWFMDGARYLGDQQISPLQTNSGPRNLNLTGTPALFLFNKAEGEVIAWFMDGGDLFGEQAIRKSGDAGCRVAGQGDFSGNGHQDILLQHPSTGQVHLWAMNGLTFLRDQYIRAVEDPNWKIAGVGDFNKDGQPDILWQHQTTGQIHVWFMNGTAYLRDRHVATVEDPNWKIAGVGDFDKDGQPDILWQHQTTGQVYVWFMNGTTFTRDELISTISDTGWKIIRVGDTDGDGYPDILWQHLGSGDIFLWHMKGTRFIRDQYIKTNGDLN